MNQFMHIPRDDPRTAAQAVLPARLGGLGIVSTPLEVADGAFLAAAAVSHKVFAGGSECLRPFYGPHGQHLQEAWQALNHVEQLCPELPGPASGETIAKVVPAVQQSVSMEIARRRRVALLDSYDITTCEGECILARLRNFACRASTMWWSALPLSPDLRMTDVELTLCIRHLLCIPPNAFSSRCACGMFKQPHIIDHAMNCALMSGTWTGATTTLKEYALDRFPRACGIHAHPEYSVICPRLACGRPVAGPR